MGVAPYGVGNAFILSNIETGGGGGGGGTANTNIIIESISSLAVFVPLHSHSPSSKFWN